MREPKQPPKKKTPQRLVAPTKAETSLLEPFPEIPLEKILVPRTASECYAAKEEIQAAGVAGFDTEAKPTFRKGQKCTGPHIVQFSLHDKAYIFQLCHEACEKSASQLIASEKILKVGFGLKNDHKQIRDRFGVSLNHVLDLDQVFRKIGYPSQIGVRGAMGVLFNLCFKKSKATTTSNWALPELSEKQLLYAANDAYAALKILEGLERQGLLAEHSP